MNIIKEYKILKNKQLYWIIIQKIPIKIRYVAKKSNVSA